MPEITNLHDLIGVAAFVAKQSGTMPWWRGQTDQEWKLVPGAFRHGRTSETERNMAIRFMAKARTRRAICPDDGDLAGWLALMQHHRLPTRLLDWTESPLVATYFAVCEESARDGVLWCLNPYRLNEVLVGKPTLLGPKAHEVQAILRGVFESNAIAEGKVLALTPWETDLRMLLQASAFTIHGGPKELESLPIGNEILECLRIPARAKRGIAQHLNLLGVRRSTLFPDLDNLAADLAQIEMLGT